MNTRGHTDFASHHEEMSEIALRQQCGVPVGFGMRCRRQAGHLGVHTWDPKTLLGEEAQTDEEQRS